MLLFYACLINIAQIFNLHADSVINLTLYVYVARWVVSSCDSCCIYVYVVPVLQMAIALLN
jgi:hypothetical protein